jgi:hypothetical protein
MSSVPAMRSHEEVARGLHRARYPDDSIREVLELLVEGWECGAVVDGGQRQLPYRLPRLLNG